MRRGLVLGLLLGLLLAAYPGAAQGPEGICEGTICGPSGAFTVAEIPTIVEGLAWDRFPANPARPYVAAAGGRVWYVAPGGDDAQSGTSEAPLATLRAALAVAQSGDVIWMRAGEYAIGEPYTYEALVIDTPGITLAAEQIGAVTLRPAGEGEAAPAIGIQVLADDVVVDGFVLRDFRAAGVMYGRAGDPQRNLVLKHLRIEGVDEGILSTYDGDGQQPMIDGMLVYDVWLRDIGLIGLQCGQGPCNNMRWEALRIEMPGAGEGSGADALAVESGEHIVVFNADISGAYADGIDVKATGAVVANVIVHDVGRNGIKLWGGGDVINALVYNTGADAAVVFETGSYRVVNSLVARHNWGESSYGMTVGYDTPDTPGQLAIINSVFYQNAGAIWVSPAMTLDVRNSLFFGAGNGQELIWDPFMVGAAASPITALEDAGGGSGNLGAVDPLFTNPDGGDYGWGPDSPLLNAGTDTTTLPAFDLFGASRRVGAVDLGPWEYQGGE